jgi:hypothetical protein
VSATDPNDSYHAHQARRQVYVVLRVSDGAGPLADRISVVAIHRVFEAAQRDVDARNAKAAGAQHFWRVAWIPEAIE